MLTKFHGQAWQDAFVDAVLNGKRDGTFLELGACHPIELSNTYALESELGWRGLMADNDPGAVMMCRGMRKSAVVEADVTSPRFRDLLEIHYGQDPVRLGYLSLDVDAASLDALKNLPHQLSFDVLTIESDVYRFGPGPRDAMRMHLLAFGYILVGEDVCSSDGLPYEDWWVHPDIPKKQWEKFVSKNMPWPQIMAQAGVKVP